MSVADFTMTEIIEAVWHLIAPNHAGEGGVEGGVRERAIFANLYETATLRAEAPTPTRPELAELQDILNALVEAGRLIHDGKGWRTPEPPEDAMYRLTMQGEKYTYSFRGSQEHDARATARTLADLTGYREDYLLAVFIAALKPGKSRRLGAQAQTIRFIVERSS